MVLGEFIIKSILHENIEKLWQTTHLHGGISKQKYMDYFNGLDMGYALEIETVTQYENPIPIEQFGLKTPPQFFAYAT